MAIVDIAGGVAWAAVYQNLDLFIQLMELTVLISKIWQ